MPADWTYPSPPDKSKYYLQDHTIEMLGQGVHHTKLVLYCRLDHRIVRCWIPGADKAEEGAHKAEGRADRGAEGPRGGQWGTEGPIFWLNLIYVHQMEYIFT